MGDIVSKAKRSEIMSHIRGKDTNPEIVVRKYLFNRGFRFRKNDRRYPGTPDVVLPKYKVIIFVNGCFWHGHTGCKYASVPKTNTEFWKQKIMKNKERDVKNKEILEEMGFQVIVIWECELRYDLESKMDEVVNRIRSVI